MPGGNFDGKEERSEDGHASFAVELLIFTKNAILCFTFFENKQNGKAMLIARVVAHIGARGSREFPRSIRRMMLRRWGYRWIQSKHKIHWKSEGARTSVSSGTSGASSYLVR